jgi:hypothetical protein
MSRATQDARRVWLVEIETGLQDPNGLARAWMDAQARPALTIDLDYNRLTLYTPDGAPPAMSSLPLMPQLPTVGGSLLGIDLPVREFRPGDTIHLGLYTESEPTRIQMVHAEGLLYAERTVSLVAGSAFTRSDVPIPVTQATPSGEYAVLSGAVRLATITVTHSDPLWREQDVPHPLKTDLGDSIELLGYAVEPSQPHPGDSVVVDLYWRARAPIQTAYTVFAQIVGPFNPASNNPVWGQQDNPPVSGAFSTTDWPVGMIVRDRHTLRLDPAAPPADYSIIVGLYNPLTGERLPIPGHSDNALPVQSFRVP